MAFTFFFRDRQTLDYIADEVLPTLRGYQHVRIWDAGCAHGPEAYSMAMLLRENATHFGFRNIHIDATDIDTTGEFARTVTDGIYHERELKRIPSEFKEKYFQPAPTPGCLQVCDEIRRSVSFARHDLLTLRAPRIGFRLIVCKNVLLHFPPARRVEVIQMFHEALADGGFLVTEHTQALPDQLAPSFERATGRGQIFRKRPTAAKRAAA